MSSEEEVVEVSENGHGGVPDQVEEGLQDKKGNFVLFSTQRISTVCDYRLPFDSFLIV